VGPTIGLYYNGARYLAAWLGRWTSADPIGMQAGVNLYQYCRGSPINYVDPSGTTEVPLFARDPLAYVFVRLNEKWKAGPTAFVQGMGEKAGRLVEPFKTVYGDDGMLDRAAQKGVDQLILGKPPRDYVTPEEHKKFGRAAVDVSLSLLPLPGPAGVAAKAAAKEAPIIAKAIEKGAESAGVLENLVAAGKKLLPKVNDAGDLALAGGGRLSDIPDVAAGGQGVLGKLSQFLLSKGGGGGGANPLTSAKDVGDYLAKNGSLPSNFVKKAEAKALGWDPRKGNLDVVAPGKSIGGDEFKNLGSPPPLPNAPGRKWFEADVDYAGGHRGGSRLVYSNDGAIYSTTDHYKTFTKVR